MRGHTSLVGGVDATILVERKVKTFSTILPLQKLKDEASNLALTAHLARVVIANDEDGEEVSTLIVDRIEDGRETAKSAKPPAIPPQRRLLLEVFRFRRSHPRHEYWECSAVLNASKES